MTTTTTGEASTSASATSSDTAFLQDVGSNADLGGAVPEGCQGKIDFLFVLSTSSLLADIQPQLVAAFPKFIDTITTKFENFDYHIMVVDGDPRWGNAFCTGACPDLSCDSDDPCCPNNALPDGLCCTEQNYPCEQLDLVSECDKTLGAGTVFPAGHMAANKICKLDGGRRYITQDQGELSETFSCIAQLGFTGGSWVGPALVSAVSPELNGPGGCNEGFLREDALLMVTMLTAGTGDMEPSKAPEWYDAVVAAKNGDANAIVAFLIGNPACPFFDDECQMTQMFPHSLVVGRKEEDIAPGFDAATDLFELVCESQIPQ